MSRGREFGEGPLFRATTTVHWFLVLQLWLVLALLPSIVLTFALVPDPTNLPLFALAAVPVGPALSAAFFTWHRYDDQRDVPPSRHFRRGYRVNVADALRVWVPAVLLLTVLGTNVAFGGAVGVGFPLVLMFLALGALVLVLALRMLTVTSAFAFRWRDALRIALVTVASQPLRTLGLLSYVLLVVGLTVLTFDAVVVLLASLLTYAVHRNDAPVLMEVRRRFVAA